jgi:hypothetical protein
MLGGVAMHYDYLPQALKSLAAPLLMCHNNL